MKRPLKQKPLIDRFAETYAVEHGIQNVLDLGTGEGRNALRLAGYYGMNVLGVDIDPLAISAARNHARQRGLSVHFERGDVTNFQPGILFDAVISNEVLHQLPKEGQGKLLQAMQDHTRVGGFNVVSGYLVKPDDTRAAALLTPDELVMPFEQPGWEVVEYNETWLPDQTLSSGKIVTTAFAEVIAQRLR